MSYIKFKQNFELSQEIKQKYNINNFVKLIELDFEKNYQEAKESVTNIILLNQASLEKVDAIGDEPNFHRIRVLVDGKKERITYNPNTERTRPLFPMQIFVNRKIGETFEFEGKEITIEKIWKINYPSQLSEEIIANYPQYEGLKDYYLKAIPEYLEAFCKTSLLNHFKTDVNGMFERDVKDEFEQEKQNILHSTSYLEIGKPAVEVLEKVLDQVEDVKMLVPVTQAWARELVKDKSEYLKENKYQMANNYGLLYAIQIKSVINTEVEKYIAQKCEHLLSEITSNQTFDDFTLASESFDQAFKQAVSEVLSSKLSENLDREFA